MKAALGLLLCLATVAVGLVTCVLSTSNHDRARRLAEQQRQWEMLEAANQQALAITAAHVWGVPNGEAVLGTPREEGPER